MLNLTNEELINVYGGAKMVISPTYELFMKVYKLTYNFIKSLIR